MGFADKLERATRKTQAQGRIPALSVAVRRADRPLWTFQVGTAGPGKVLDAGTQFRLGSVTKTFTAALILQCRDAGLLDLDDPIGKHLAVPAHGEHTIRNLLAHRSGLQREPYGNVWDTAIGPDTAEVLADLANAGQVLPPQRRFHYSNLAFAVLGHLAAAKRGGSWAEVLGEYLLEPLGLKGITVQPTKAAATGYLVDAYSDHARVEPPVDTAGAGPAAQLWGTAADSAKWASFLTDPAEIDPEGKILSAATLAEAAQPHTLKDEAQWASGIGLGLMLEPKQDRIMHIGHYGAMYGFLAAVFGRRGPEEPKGFGAAVLGSSGTADETNALVHELLTISAGDLADIQAWTPAGPVPERYAPLLGRWWTEGFGLTFVWHDGELRARSDGAPAGAPPAVFAPVSGDLMRTVSGREAGEDLELIRGDDGEITAMRWATYLVTREHRTPLVGD